MVRSLGRNGKSFFQPYSWPVPKLKPYCADPVTSSSSILCVGLWYVAHVMLCREKSRRPKCLFCSPRHERSTCFSPKINKIMRLSDAWLRMPRFRCVARDRLHAEARHASRREHPGCFGCMFSLFCPFSRHVSSTICVHRSIVVTVSSA